MLEGVRESGRPVVQGEVGRMCFASGPFQRGAPLAPSSAVTVPSSATASRVSPAGKAPPGLADSAVSRTAVPFTGSSARSFPSGPADSTTPPETIGAWAAVRDEEDRDDHSTRPSAGSILAVPAPAAGVRHPPPRRWNRRAWRCRRSATRYATG